MLKKQKLALFLADLDPSKQNCKMGYTILIEVIVSWICTKKRR